MDIEIINASRTFLRECKFAVFAQNLKTKIRIILKGNYFLDMYYNKTLGKYAYTLVMENRRVIGWDNAPHHKGLDNFPHHFHTTDGQTLPSKLKGNPETDVYIVIEVVNKFFVSTQHTIKMKRRQQRKTTSTT